MKTFLTLTLFGLLTLSSLAQDKADQKRASTEAISISGEIIDIKCYSTGMMGGHGPEHEECALACIKGGLPVGLLEDKTDAVFLIVPAKGMKGGNEEVAQFVAKRVTLRGKIVEKGGQKIFHYSSVNLAE